MRTELKPMSSDAARLPSTAGGPITCFVEAGCDGAGNVTLAPMTLPRANGVGLSLANNVTSFVLKRLMYVPSNASSGARGAVTHLALPTAIAEGK